MTTHGEILAAVLANPQDDVVRKAYADWCRENGQEQRADFVEVQLELAKLPTVPKTDAEIGSADWHVRMHEFTIPPPRQPCHWCDLRKCEGHLWSVIDKGQFVPWHRGPIGYSFSGPPVVKLSLGEAALRLRTRRGFVSEVRYCTLRQWFARPCDRRPGTGLGPEIVKCCPVEFVQLADKSPEPHPLVNAPSLWCWCAGDTYEPTSLPIEVFRLMGGDHSRPLTFFTREDAENAASAGLIAWAKAEASTAEAASVT